MKIIKNMAFPALAIFFYGFSMSSYSERVMLQTFDRLKPKLYESRNGEREFTSIVGADWANGFEKPGDSREPTDRVSGDRSTYVGDGAYAKSVKIRYPRNGYDSKLSGAQWQTPFDRGYRELYLSYWVKPQPAVDWTLGGKLPGYGGDLGGNAREDEWSAKLMWREGGELEFYLHVPGSPRETSFKWNHTGSVARLRAGRWNHVQYRIRLNTPGRSDGIMQGWLNGELRGEERNFRFIGNSSEHMDIDYFFFSTFYGGNETYAPKSDQFFWFDQVRVTTHRQNYSSNIRKQ